MDLNSKGRLIHEAELTVEPVKFAELVAAIGTPTAGETASLVVWFGATIGGDDKLVQALDMDLSRALLSGQRYDWNRPFQPGETVRARLSVEEVTEKGSNHLAVILAEFRDASGELIQSQHTTFIERAAT
ncbi:MAG TPA: MaoC family dehydratase N-terminal domain-containing protein [Mycobacteriales bacterium]|jgi:acyl dehydratase|nr:MaoC family dehydratase N-terminal domain-containing protein [Mycobacteriales bacterium]